MREKDNSKDFIFLDTERLERNRFTETLFCQGKSLEQLSLIIREMLDRGENLFGTRIEESTALELVRQFPGLVFDRPSRTIQIIQNHSEPLQGTLALLAAGTSDLPVAEEAYQTARFYGLEVRRFYDVGVAGLHRLEKKISEIKNCDVAIVVAGMDGALPSVLGGLVSLPIIACPTSVGYGAHFKGLATLAAMLNSCSEGIVVVNIDNGFGAACASLRILRKKSLTGEKKV